jgi:hypothetical protein
MKEVYYHETDEEFDEFWKKAPKWVKSPVRLIRSPAKNKCIDQKKADGSGGKTARGECRKELGGNIFVRGAKRLALAGPRGAFLQLVRLNYRGLASRTNRAKTDEPKIYEEAISKFVKLGGSAKAFKNAINAGKGKKPIICGKKCKSKHELSFDGGISEDEKIFFDEFPDHEFNNVVETATITAIIGSASAILIPIIAIVGKSKATRQEAMLNSEEAENTRLILEEQGKQEQAKSESETKMVKSLMIGGSIILAVLVGGVIITKVVKRKKG